MTQKIIYLDNAATTKVDEKVVKAMLPYFSKKYANASSSHSFGRAVKEDIEKARVIIAKSINASAEEIYFTSGGTEANNWALKEIFFSNKNSEKNHIITTKIEHPSILEVCKLIEKIGGKITYLNVDKEGFIDIKELEKEINEKTILVSIIQGNNEIGTLQDIEVIGKICKSHGVLLHVDACQSFTKTKFDMEKQKIDLMTLNGHKIHGPKGIGALYIRKGIKIESFLHGGGHERGKRSGTENVPGIIGFAEAVKISNQKDIKNMEKLRDYLIKGILKIPKTRLNGSVKKRLCNNINISFTNIEGEAISSYLEAQGIIVSTGSACASHSLKKSHVLKAIGLNDLEINSSIRISISKCTTKKEVNFFLKVLPKIVATLRKMSPYAK
jgi:cysteine desulfurase